MNKLLYYKLNINSDKYYYKSNIINYMNTLSKG